VAVAVCACSCGEKVAAGRDFKIGHDQRAIRERINRRWGGALGFVRWFDAEYENACPPRV
jgi:predicted aminopeptidase